MDIWFVVSIILSPIVLAVLLLMLIAWGLGFGLILNMYNAGKSPEVDSSNLVGRVLGFFQLSRHIPKLMKAVFVYDITTDDLLSIEPGIYSLSRRGLPFNEEEHYRVEITRPMLNMNRQDLMEQLDFRPDDNVVT